MGNYSASIRYNKISIWLWERPKTHHFYDFEIVEPVTKPQNQLLLFLETTQNKPRNITGTLSNNIVVMNLIF